MATDRRDEGSGCVGLVAVVLVIAAIVAGLISIAALVDPFSLMPGVGEIWDDCEDDYDTTQDDCALANRFDGFWLHAAVNLVYVAAAGGLLVRLFSAVSELREARGLRFAGLEAAERYARARRALAWSAGLVGLLAALPIVVALRCRRLSGSPERADCPRMEQIAQHYFVGEPQVSGPLAVFPVFGPPPWLGYRAFARASQLGAFVKELDEGASVRQLLVENPTELPLLIYEGEEVLGAQQNRTFDVSVLVAAGDRLRAPVSCVEEGRWDGARFDERMRPAPHAADPGLRRTKRRRSNENATRGQDAVADQGEVWHEVSGRLAELGVASDSAALSDVYDGRRRELDALIEGVAHADAQLGAVAAVEGRPIALDLVSRPEVFAALLPSLVQGYALEALRGRSVASGIEDAEAFCSEALEAPRLNVGTPGMGRGFALGTARLIGSALEHDGELIQLSAFPGEGTVAPAAQAAAGRIARPSRRRRS